MKFVVLYGGRYPLLFHRNLCGNVYSVVKREEATTFTSEQEAMRTAIAHRMERHHFTIAGISNHQDTKTPREGVRG